MLLRREGYPEEKEFVLCKVTNVQYHCVMASLDEYGKEGMIHISEVSPGRIRNINDFVRVGKVIVCMVLKVDTHHNRIDLSLRRVTDNQKRNKVNLLKREQMAEKIIETVAEEKKLKVEKLYKDVIAKVFKDYDFLIYFFEDVVEGDAQLEKYIDTNLVDDFKKIIGQRIKPKEVEIGGVLSLENYEVDGVDIVQKALIAAEKVNKEVTIRYKGGGSYNVTVKAKDYKAAENILKKVIDTASKPIEKCNGVAKFDRVETKK